MKVEDGYVKVKKFLESKFGQKYKIVMVYMDKVINGLVIKVEDVDVLEGFVVLFFSCINIFKVIGYFSKFESLDSMWKIIERFFLKL